MDLNLIKRLIRVVEKSDITEFSISEGDVKIKISKNNGRVAQVVTNVPVQAPTAAVHPPVSESKTKSSPAAEEAKAENIHEVRSPIVGTFYRAPAPDADPYVRVGDHVSAGTVLCIVEAMKLMNEIESDVTGTIEQILVENATPVEYNQPLFVIKKD